MTDVVDIYYDKDETVQEDEEVQAFVKDVCSFGMQDFDHCGKYTVHLIQTSKLHNTKEYTLAFILLIIMGRIYLNMN